MLSYKALNVAIVAMWKYSHIMGVYRHRPRCCVLLMANRVRIIPRAKVARKKPMTISAPCDLEPIRLYASCQIKLSKMNIEQNEHKKGANTNWQRPIKKVI